MRDLAVVGLVLLAVLALALLAVAMAGAALGLFVGALLWAAEVLAGPFAPDGTAPWWALAVLALILLADVLRARGSRVERRPT